MIPTTQLTEKRKKKGALLRWCMIVLSLLGTLLTGSAFSLAQDKIVAVVNNEVITQRDLDDFITFMRVQLSREYSAQQLEEKIRSIKADLLTKLIEDRLIIQEAKRENLKADDARLKDRLEEIKKRYGSEEAFQQALTSQGIVLGDVITRVKEQLLMYMIIGKKVRDKIVINPGEVTDYYYKHGADFKNPEQREFDSVEIPDRSTAEELYAKLKAGEALIDLVITHALKVSKLTAAAGGELKKEIEQAVFNLNIDEVSRPVLIDDKYYIFRLKTIIPANVVSFDEVKDRLYRFMYDQKMQEGLVNWLEALKKKAYIKIMQ